MEKMGLNDIREAFLKFWESKGHYRLKSFPLIPQHDKSLHDLREKMGETR